MPSANLHFPNKSQGLSLSSPLWRFAIFSSTNPRASCLQNSYEHLPIQRIKVTLQEWVCTSVSFMSSQATAFASLPSHAPVSTAGEMSPALDSWWKQCGAVGYLDAKKSSAIGFMRNKPSRCECRLWKSVPDMPETLPVPSALSLLMG